MCREKIRSVAFLIRFCIAFHAKAPASFWGASEEDLRRVYNKIELDVRLAWICYVLLRSFSASAFILGWEFAQPEKTLSRFTAANLRLIVNVAREALYDCHPLGIFAAIPIAFLCEIFGWKSFKKGIQNVSNGI